MYAWMNREGKWLQINERTTHTGHHVTANWVADINRASVATRLPPKLNVVDALKIPVEVEETRIVTVKVEMVDAAGTIA